MRNLAIENAHGDWILEIDADERVSPALREEIVEFLREPRPFDIAGMPSRHWFLGRWLGPSAQYPSYRIRLLRRGSYRHDESRTVHEGLWTRGPMWQFTGDLHHLLATTWREALKDVWRYARLEAGQATSPTTASALSWGLIGRPVAKWVYRVFVLRGWRDGWQGVVKICLDCLSDALVWVRRLRTPDPQQCAANQVAGHFGQRHGYSGPVRLVGLALKEEALDSVIPWLRQAHRDGAEPVLITKASRRPPSDLRVREMSRPTPFALLRALEAETQINPIDALVLTNRTHRFVSHILPRHLRGSAAPLSTSTKPERAVAAVRSARSSS
jgi:hypothetical protein